ncbi:hypothetical protein M430DRAFT_196962 [Amorphotheca resinae ATCC 22711]|uniref:Uncharacterized protein n=1 Tax=Amorphotheca resinae ATCC 22711 TaxID=857342 RepID=A0A2T3B9M4_AMORE|nr:hypothetical protein M430DRAFT_196962 [Amorphotheca resinae ATCC 22711]PSS24974.1 hypothetical protein M430DRAFT_196962 [Amorphotheca resinae ATCC 22711]
MACRSPAYTYIHILLHLFPAHRAINLSSSAALQVLNSDLENRIESNRIYPGDTRSLPCSFAPPSVRSFVRSAEKHTSTLHFPHPRLPYPILSKQLSHLTRNPTQPNHSAATFCTRRKKNSQHPSSPETRHTLLLEGNPKTAAWTPDVRLHAGRVPVRARPLHGAGLVLEL